MAVPVSNDLGVDPILERLNTDLGVVSGFGNILAPPAPESSFSRLRPVDLDTLKTTAPFREIESLARRTERVVPKTRPDQHLLGQGFQGTPYRSRGRSDAPGYRPVADRYRISQGDDADHSVGPGGHAWDYAVPVGTAVRATTYGTVIAVKNLGNRSYGKYVMVKGRNGKTYIFAHLSGFNARVGQRVTPGHIIARSGNSGKSTGSHLHYEIRG